MDKVEAFLLFERMAEQHVQDELNGLRAFKAAIQDKPDVEALYFGRSMDEPDATNLIHAAFDYVLERMCKELGVEHYNGYESDGSLDDAICHDVRSILKEAHIISDWDGTIARHPEDRDERLEAEYLAAKRSVNCPERKE